MHVYFSGKTAKALSANTQFLAINLPNATYQQDCICFAMHKGIKVEIVNTETKASITIKSEIEMQAWIRFNFSYISLT